MMLKMLASPVAIHMMRQRQREPLPVNNLASDNLLYQIRLVIFHLPEGRVATQTRCGFVQGVSLVMIYGLDGLCIAKKKRRCSANIAYTSVRRVPAAMPAKCSSCSQL